MIQPQLYKDSVVVINPQIASRASIDSLKKALVFNVTDGLGQPAKSDKVLVAGMQGTSSLSTNEDSTKDMYAVEFCGYFPTDNPKYSIIVSINKTGLPASGGLMAGDVFKKIIVNLNRIEMTKMSQCSTCIGDGVHCEHYRPTDDSPCPNYIFDTSNTEQGTIKYED